MRVLRECLRAFLGGFCVVLGRGCLVGGFGGLGCGLAVLGFRTFDWGWVIECWVGVVALGLVSLWAPEFGFRCLALWCCFA